MTLVLGGALATGVLLVAAPWLWPPRRRERPASPLSVRVALLLAEAGASRISPRMFLGASALAAVLGAATVWLVFGVPVLSLVVLVAGGAAPVIWARQRARRLARERRALWPDVCDHLVAAVRAGMSLPDAIASLAESAPAGLRPAFSSFALDLAASGHFDSSARMLKDRLADPVADRIVETLRMAREVGGAELTAVLRSLSVSVRADGALHGELDARQSWIRGAALLGVIAPWAVLGMLSLREEGFRAYTSPDGVVLVLVGALVSGVAYALMRRIGRPAQQRRWLR